MSYYVAFMAALQFLAFCITLRTVPNAPRKPEPSNRVLCVVAAIHLALWAWGLFLLLGDRA